jgi:hypothetical protein
VYGENDELYRAISALEADGIEVRSEASDRELTEAEQRMRSRRESSEV